MSHARIEATRNTYAQGSDPNQVFAVNDLVVYPAHGVGRVEMVGPAQVAGMSIDVIQIAIDDTSMTVKVPFAKIGKTGLRKVSTPASIQQALTVLHGKPKMSKVMWARRAQDYEQKITSGDPLLLAEVARDLRRNALASSDGSFSERQIFERAIDRLAAEVAAVEKITKAAASERLIAGLSALQAGRSADAAKNAADIELDAEPEAD